MEFCQEEQRLGARLLTVFDYHPGTLAKILYFDTENLMEHKRGEKFCLYFCFPLPFVFLFRRFEGRRGGRFTRREGEGGSPGENGRFMQAADHKSK